MDKGYVNARDLEGQTEQVRALEEHGIKKWISEKINGKLNRSELDELVGEKGSLRKGDRVFVRSLYDLPLTALQAIELITHLNKEGIELISLSEKVDLKTIKTLNGLNRATRRIRAKQVLEDSPSKPGPKAGEITQDSYEKGLAAAYLYKTDFAKGNISISELMEKAKIKSKSTLYARLEENGVDFAEVKAERKKALKEKREAEKKALKESEKY